MKLHLTLILSLKLIHIVDGGTSPQNTNGENKIRSLLFLKAKTADEYSVPIEGDRSLISFNHNKLKLYSVCPNENPAKTANFQRGEEYTCNNDFEPQNHISYRIKCKSESEKLTIFSYIIRFKNEEKEIGFKDEENKDKDRHFIVYTLCSDSNSVNVFARYKVIPHLPTLHKIPNIDHSDFSKFPQHLQNIYSTQFQVKNSKFSFKSKKSFADRWKDQIIPQTLVPSFNISSEYSKGVTNRTINHQPQWLSLADQWDSVNHFIKLRAYKFNWTIHTGTYEILLNKKKKPITFTADIMIPRIWWILIEHKEINEDIKSVKAIIIAMSNIPKNADDIHEEGRKLCEVDVCDNAKWKDIQKNKFIHCCTVDEFLGKKFLDKEYPQELLELPEVDDTKKITSARILVSYYSPNELSSASPQSPPTSPKSN